jgi:hypothetical protein
MILAICTAGPIGHPSRAGTAKIAVSQARSAITSSASVCSARQNASVPIWPTRCEASSIWPSLSGAMLSIGVTRPERTASLTSWRGMSARVWRRAALLHGSVGRRRGVGGIGERPRF